MAVIFAADTSHDLMIRGFRDIGKIAFFDQDPGIITQQP